MWYRSMILFSLQPEESLKEDFLFPMSNRLSYASSPESDVEMGRPGKHWRENWKQED